MIRESISYVCKIIEYESRRKSLIVRKTEVNDDVNVPRSQNPLIQGIKSRNYVIGD